MTSQLHYFHPDWIQTIDTTLNVDICVYGGTSAGIMAAIAAKQRGKSVVLLTPGKHLGGMTSGGLGFTDVGNKHIIGGLARNFYQRLGQHYGQDEAWKFEPHVGQQIFQEMLKEHEIQVKFCQYVEDVTVIHARITRLTCLGGLKVTADYFIDTTYEGDLMAKAGVGYRIGRESNAEFGESSNGVQILEKHQFDCPVDPYKIPGDSTSGLLPGISAEPISEPGSASPLIQAYNFRVCMTTNPENRLPFPKPANYDPEQYTLTARWLQCTQANVFQKFDMITSGKTDTNNHGAVSTDFIGQNHDWPEANYQTREDIFQAHVVYQQGLHWFMANDPSVPESIRAEYARWGLAADEFTDTNHWPPQLYIREARRMEAEYMVTEHDCFGRQHCGDSVGMAAYQMDSHNCQRVIVDGLVKNEGDVQALLPAPYPISYRSIIPRKAECENLAVPVCLSASHIAFGSIRMEPVFMVLAESASIAACLASQQSSALQDVEYAKLRTTLLDAGQILETDAKNTEAINPE
jgi:hypothetical protein